MRTQGLVAVEEALVEKSPDPILELHCQLRHCLPIQGARVQPKFRQDLFQQDPALSQAQAVQVHDRTVRQGKGVTELVHELIAFFHEGSLGVLRLQCRHQCLGQRNQGGAKRGIDGIHADQDAV